jgi:hypothetical protein
MTDSGTIPSLSGVSFGQASHATPPRQENSEVNPCSRTASWEIPIPEFQPWLHAAFSVMYSAAGTWVRTHCMQLHFPLAR